MKEKRKAVCHPEKDYWANGLCHVCYRREYQKSPRGQAAKKKHYEKFREVILTTKREKRRNDPEYNKRKRLIRLKTSRKAKLEALTHYGPKGVLRCCWKGCFIDDIDMLTLDHIKDDGADHRRALKHGGSSTDLYSKCRSAGYPGGFQTLCWNHQWKKQILRCTKEREGRYASHN